MAATDWERLVQSIASGAPLLSYTVSCSLLSEPLLLIAVPPTADTLPPTLSGTVHQLRNYSDLAFALLTRSAGYERTVSQLRDVSQPRALFLCLTVALSATHCVSATRYLSVSQPRCANPALCFSHTLPFCVSATHCVSATRFLSVSQSRTVSQYRAVSHALCLSHALSITLCLPVTLYLCAPSLHLFYSISDSVAHHRDVTQRETETL